MGERRQIDTLGGSVFALINDIRQCLDISHRLCLFMLFTIVIWNRTLAYMTCLCAKSLVFAHASSVRSRSRWKNNELNIWIV